MAKTRATGKQEAGENVQNGAKKVISCQFKDKAANKKVMAQSENLLCKAVSEVPRALITLQRNTEASQECPHNEGRKNGT